MKKIFVLLLFFCITAVAIAKPQNDSQSFEKDKIKIEKVMPTFDFDFVEAKYLPLDVYAPAVAKIDFDSQKTLSGFAVVEEKPPIYLVEGIK